jgi:hypothetical protein
VKGKHFLLNSLQEQESEKDKLWNRSKPKGTEKKRREQGKPKKEKVSGFMNFFSLHSNVFFMLLE